MELDLRQIRALAYNFLNKIYMNGQNLRTCLFLTIFFYLFCFLVDVQEIETLLIWVIWHRDFGLQKIYIKRKKKKKEWDNCFHVP